jgi:hypothetical protein
MAVKTKAELVTQSDNTFLDNTTGQIVPTNHRLWNDDVLDTMFGAIAGQIVTKAEFDDLVTNNLLIVNSIYTITPYQFGPFGTSINVIARSANEVGILGYCDAYDSCAILQSDVEANAVKIVKHHGTGILVNNLPDAVTSFLGADVYAKGAEFSFNNISDPTIPFLGYVGKTAYDTDNQPLNHSLYAQLTSKLHWYSGFFGFGNNKFYPNHGSQNTWGEDASQLTYYDTLRFIGGDGVAAPSIVNLKGNFIKENTNVFGMISFLCDADFGAVDVPYIDFNLPHEGVVPYTDTIIGHGQAITENGNGRLAHVILTEIVQIGVAKELRCYFKCLGNLNSPHSLKVSFSFSYSLEPA